MQTKQEIINQIVSRLEDDDDLLRRVAEHTLGETYDPTYGVVQTCREDLPEHYELGYDDIDPSPNFGSEQTGLCVYIDYNRVKEEHTFLVYTEDGEHVVTKQEWKSALKELV